MELLRLRALTRGEVPFQRVDLFSLEVNSVKNGLQRAAEIVPDHCRHLPDSRQAFHPPEFSRFLLHQLFKVLRVLRELLFKILALDGVVHSSLQGIHRRRAFHEIILRTLTHRVHRQFQIVETVAKPWLSGRPRSSSTTSKLP